MICAWKSFLSILPLWMRQDVNDLGKNTLQELRLRVNAPPILKLDKSTIQLSAAVAAEDLHFCVNTASRYSPWTAATAQKGYVTAPGGHRIGICGNASGSAGSLTSIQGLTSLCIRVAKDFPGIAANTGFKGKSVLILGSPGSGKTTLLRDMIRQYSDTYDSNVAVVDEREEIFPRVNGTFCFPVGKNTDVLSACSKIKGIDTVLRTMGPDVIAIDEITAHEDCQALLHAGWCGVSILATAHATGRADLMQRSIYRPLIESQLFDILIILSKDKTWRIERLNI